MDREQIAQLAHQLESKDDILTLLNRMRMEDVGEDTISYPFTMKQLNYYCNPNHVFHRYNQFEIKKKSGGTRVITSPRGNTFKLILYYVNELFKSLYTPSAYAMGFTEGRSVVSNAQVHLGQNYVFNTDLKNFFPSIDQARVWKRLQLAPFNFPVQVANVLAGLCAMKVKDDDKARYVLPQGAPTSPIITNMICDNLDRRLAGLAKRFGLRYTRYADDITFSSMHNVYQENGNFMKELHRIIEGQNLTINTEKTRLQKKGCRQEVTGLIVGEKVNVTKKYVRDIRNILYIWERYGFGVAYSKFFPKYMLEKGHVKKGDPDMINVLDGKLMYLKMVKGENDSVYMRLYAKFNELVDDVCNLNYTTEQTVTYVETKSIQDFEESNNTEIIFEMSKPTMDENGAIVKESHRYSYFVLNGKKIYVSINKSINKDEFPPKEQLSISCCRDAHNKQFWLIHKSDKITSTPVEVIDVDALNDELDSLLMEY
jgi:retron-type reverse transcriptase